MTITGTASGTDKTGVFGLNGSFTNAAFTLTYIIDTGKVTEVFTPTGGPYTGSSISAQGTKLALLTQPRRLIYVEACFNLLPKYVSAAFGSLADIEKKIKDIWRSIVNIVNPDRAEFQRLHDEIEAFKGSAQDGKLKELEY